MPECKKLDCCDQRVTHDVERWQARIRELDRLIAPLHNERLLLERKILAARSQFGVGDLIEWEYGVGTRCGRVEEIQYWVCGNPMWKVQHLRKDGTFGATCVVRPYQNPKLVRKAPPANEKG